MTRPGERPHHPVLIGVNSAKLSFQAFLPTCEKHTPIDIALRTSLDSPPVTDTVEASRCFK